MRFGIYMMLALWAGGALAGCTMIHRYPPDGMVPGDSGLDSSFDFTVDRAGGDDLGDGSAGDSDLVVPPDLVPPDRGPDSGLPLPDMAGGDLGDMGPTGLVLRGSFAGGAVFGAQGAYALQGQFAWHGRVAGSGGGYALSGWLR
jgi:hypothetical protein